MNVELMVRIASENLCGAYDDKCGAYDDEGWK